MFDLIAAFLHLFHFSRAGKGRPHHMSSPSSAPQAGPHPGQKVSPRSHLSSSHEGVGSPGPVYVSTLIFILLLSEHSEACIEAAVCFVP